ncbi:hypothetical protein ACJX0J_037103, partial [Zea mays]
MWSEDRSSAIASNYILGSMQIGFASTGLFGRLYTTHIGTGFLERQGRWMEEFCWKGIGNMQKGLSMHFIQFGSQVKKIDVYDIDFGAGTNARLHLIIVINVRFQSYEFYNMIVIYVLFINDCHGFLNTKV